MGLFMSRGRNKKYSKELKLKAVQSYLRGEGSLRQVCREYEIKDEKSLREWILWYSQIRNVLSQKVYFAWRSDFGNRALSLFLQQQALPAETQMHDADGIPSRCRVKNSTLLRSRVEFLIKCFCFFTVYLTGGTSLRSGRFDYVFEQPKSLITSGFQA